MEDEQESAPTAATAEKARSALASVIDPEIGLPITQLGMVRDIEVDGSLARVHLALTTPACPLQDQIGADIAAALADVDGLDQVEVHMGAMSDDERTQVARQLTSSPSPGTSSLGPDTMVLAVGSGKGGVGKSTLTVNLACALAAMGKRVGVIDADVWGFSVPRLIGAHGDTMGIGEFLLPLQAHGVKVVSVGMFVDEEQPVVWRGPMLHEAIEQFLGGVYWGDLDILLVDLPPGTGDVAMSLARLAPTTQLVLVTTPQPAASQVAARAAAMARKAGLTVAGVVENMSSFTCPDCGTQTGLFGGGGGDDLADRLGIPLLGRIPLLPEVREGGDAGMPVVVADPDSPAAVAFAAVASSLLGVSSPSVHAEVSLVR